MNKEKIVQQLKDSKKGKLKEEIIVEREGMGNDNAVLKTGMNLLKMGDD